MKICFPKMNISKSNIYMMKILYFMDLRQSLVLYSKRLDWQELRETLSEGGPLC